MQFLLQKTWELLLPVPMPWQALLVLLLAMPLVPFLIFRGFPWLSVRALQILLFLAEVIVQILCLIEYQISQNFRKKGKPPEILYIFSDSLASVVSFIRLLRARSESLSIRAFRIPWRLRPIKWYTLPLVLLPIWVVRPYLGISAFTLSIDNSVAWWCSLEHWAMAGEWKPSNLTCRYSNSVPKWDTSLKFKEYELKGRLREYTREIEIKPNNPNNYYNRGNTYIEIEDIEAAFKDYTASITTDAKYAPGYMGRGDIYFLKGDEKTAFREYSKAINADSKYAPGYVGRGDVYLAKSDSSSAFKEYSTTVGINSKYAPGYVGRGDVYQRGEDREAALREYKRAIQVDPNYALAHAKIGNLYYLNFGDREAAVKEYEKAAELFLSDGKIRYYNEVTAILNELGSSKAHVGQRGDSPENKWPSRPI